MRTDERDNHIAAIAAKQHAAFSDRQAESVGFTRRVIDDRLEQQRWLRPLPGVLLVPGSPPSWRQRLWVAQLAVGPQGRIAFEAAAAMQRVHSFRPGPVILSVPHGDHTRLPGVVVRQTRHPWPDVDVIGGLRVTRLAETFVDLAATTKRARLAEAIDVEWSARRLSPSQIGDRLRMVAGPGRKGVRLLTSILDERLADGARPDGSRAEAELHRLVAKAGLPPLSKQFPLPGRGAMDGFTDGAWVPRRAIVEVDSRTWHDRISQRRKDNLRDHEVTRVGWAVLRILAEDIFGDPDYVIGLLRDYYAVRAVAA